MEIWMNSVEELVKLIKTKKINAKELQSYYQNRIITLDEKLKAFIEYKRDYQKPKSPLTLEGIPYALKDNILALDTRTTAASKMLWNYHSPYNASVVEQLSSSGAVLIGKTNMDEFSMGSTTENSAFFATKNPWNLECNPGGSSGGSAVAVSTGMVPFALGSDTGGSIRLPASYCGVVGLKPSYGLVSRYGLIAFCSSMDQIAPITRSVRDAAFILNVISQACPYDSNKIDVHKDYLKDIEEPVRGFRVARIHETVEKNCDSLIRKRFEEAVIKLQWLGVKVDSVTFEQYHQAYPVYKVLSNAEASSNLARYDGLSYGLKFKTDDKVNQSAQTRQRGFGQEVKRRILQGTMNLSQPNENSYYKQALAMRSKLSKHINHLLTIYDAIISPVSGRTPGKLGENLNIHQVEPYDVHTCLANLAGIPAISVPMGYTEKTPVGIQFMAARFADDKLLQIARAFEKTAGFYEDGFYPAPHLEGIQDA